MKVMFTIATVCVIIWALHAVTSRPRYKVGLVYQTSNGNYHAAIYETVGWADSTGETHTLEYHDGLWYFNADWGPLEPGEQPRPAPRVFQLMCNRALAQYKIDHPE